jgi:hypothetical protein
MTQDAKESQLIALAYEAAEERIRNGTATSQEIVHFLKLGSTKAKVEKDILELQKELIVAKTESLRAQRRYEELFSEALEAMKSYSGNGEDDDENLY